MLTRLLPGLCGPTLLLSLLVGAACQRHAMPAATATTGCIDPAKVNPAGVCPMVYDPVCGCDGKTYSNACTAEHAGVRSYQPGACAGRQ